jgi:benzoyl-CoA reductase/2-hydroxyglutaryl-CoA dehydratase subunit BcrC/BadD/HgdB
MKSLEKEYYRNYLRNEISLLIRDLEGFTQDKFTFKNFKKSVNFYSKIRILSTQLEDIITRKNISYNTYVKLMNTQNYLDVKRRINLLETSLEEYRSKKEYPKQSIPNNILLTGIMPPPLKIIEIIEGLGLKIVGNDIAFLSREISNTPKSSSYESVEEYYIQFYKRHFPDPTLLYTSDMRCQKIKELVKQKGADGVIFIGEKFCEYEYFELPILKDALKDIGRPLLSLEFSIDDSFNIEQYRTRIQAFRELLNKE